ncbi:MAG: tetratricopeptide repeat protein [Pseudomonadota bacterium]
MIRVSPVVLFCAVLVMVLPFLDLFTGSHKFLGFDDAINIINNDRIHSLSWDNIVWMFTSDKLGVYEPLSWLLKATVIEIFGIAPTTIHITSVFVHVLVSLMFYRCAVIILQQLFPTKDPAHIKYACLLLAVLFAIHPLRAEVVAWASGQSYAVGALLLLCSLYMYLRYCQEQVEGRRGYVFLAISAFCYLGGIFGKSAMVMLPLWLLLIDWFVYSRRQLPRIIIEKIPFAAIALGTVVLVALVNEQAMGNNHVILSWPEKFGRAVLAVFLYPLQSLLPFNLTPSLAVPKWGIAITDPAPFAGLLILLAICYRSIKLLKQNCWPLVLLVAYIGFLLPVLGFVQHGNPILAADRYAYVSTMPFYLAVAGLVLTSPTLSSPTRALKFAMFSFFGILLWLSVHQVRYWANDIKLWARAIAIQPYNSFALNNLGFNYWVKEDYETARLYLERAHSFAPANRFPMINLGVTYYELNRCDLAVEHYLRAAEQHHARSDGLYNNLGNCYIRLKRYKDAENAFKKAVKLNPSHPKAVKSLARVQKRLNSDR